MYNYKEEIKNDVVNYMNDHGYDFSAYNEETLNDLIEEFFTIGAVTGNGKMWYDTEKVCKSFVLDNLELALDCLCDKSVTIKDLNNELKKNTLYRFADATIRCALLEECMRELWEEENGNVYKD